MSAYVIRPYFSVFSRMPPAPAVVDTTTGNYLLTGETQGFAINATVEGGSVSVIDTGTPANNLSNVVLDASTLVQAGTSPKLVAWNSSPYMRWTPLNYLQQSQTFDNAYWGTSNLSVTANAAVAPDGTSTADKLTYSGGLTHGISSSDLDAVLTLAVPYTLSIYVQKLGIAQWFLLRTESFGANVLYGWFDLVNGVIGTTTAGGTDTLTGATITAVGSGWFRLTLSGSIATGFKQFKIEAVNADADVNSDTLVFSDVAYIWGAQINRGNTVTRYLATTSAARIGIPQEYDVALSKFGILSEPAATNLALQSEDFSTTWTTLNITVSTNTADTTAPDGLSTAEKLTNSGGAGAHIVYQQVTVATGIITTSCFAKQGTNQYLVLSVQDSVASTGQLQVFDLSDGTLGEQITGSGGAGGVSFVSSRIISIGSGWYRCILAVNNATNANPYVFPGQAGAKTGNSVLTSPQVTYNDNTDTLYVWGFQAETGSAASSYIPTLGSTVTRAMDKINAATSSLAFSATTESVYIDAKLRTSGATQDFLSLTDGSGANAIAPYVDSSNNIRLFVDNASATQADIDSLIDLTTYTRVQTSNAAQANSFAISVDGNSVQTDVSGSMPSGVTTLDIGNASGTANSISGYIYRLVAVPRRVSDGSLPTWRYNF